jgi:hypothetical protein
LCPIGRNYPSQKYNIEPYRDPNPTDNVEDDLAEISSMVFSSYTDLQGRRYAYVVSDKEQFSLKVVQFNENETNNNLSSISGNATVVAIYTLNNIDYSNDDWEDISLGPCSNIDNDVCIYIGNFGNNARYLYGQRQKFEIFKFVEPHFVGPNQTPVSQNINVTTIQFTYTTDDSDNEVQYLDGK